MFVHDCHKRVRYGETDMMGYLYYGQYPQLYEIGRVEAMRSLGMPYKVLEDELKIMMPVVHVEARYLQPAKYDDLLTIRTILKEIPSKMVTFENEICREETQLIHRATVKLFFIDMLTGARVSAPSIMVTNLKPYFGHG
jgi:acyl-CoA thioester hydrolase